MEEHLRVFVENGIQQKIRINKQEISYNSQMKKSNLIIKKQKDLLNQAINKSLSDERIKSIRSKYEKDINTYDLVAKAYSMTVEYLTQLVSELSVHMEELSEIELKNKGFVSHAFGDAGKVVIDSENKSIHFKEEGQIEIPFGVRLGTWKDISKMKIKKKEGEKS